MSANGQGWVGFDLDGTLAYYDKWRGPEHIGAPILPMVEGLKQLLTKGVHCKIFTARVWYPKEIETVADAARKLDATAAEDAIIAWCKEHIGQELEVTCCKDMGMIALYDDRCFRVETNTGRLL